MFSILDYGAERNNTDPAVNTRAFERAILAAEAEGGGTVYVPPGRYVTGNIELRSHITLKLENGALLAGSQDYNDYRFTHEPVPWAAMTGIVMHPGTCMCGFIYAENCENITIEGDGIIDGCGQGHEYFPCSSDPFGRRPHLVLFIGCTNVKISQVTLRNPALFDFYAVKCHGVFADGLTIRSWNSENGDGIDFDGTSDVVISNCIIEAGDDGISLKTTHPGHPCRNYAISNCVISSLWAAFRMGTESTADMSDIVMSNCVFTNCNDGIKIQNCSAGVYDNIRISNTVMRDVHRPVFMSVNSYRLSAEDDSIRPDTGGIKNVVIDGMTAYMSEGGEDYRRNAFIVSGTCDRRLTDITFKGVKVFFDGGGTKAEAERIDVPEYIDYSLLYADVFSINGKFNSAGPFLRHVEGLRLFDCDFRVTKPDARPMIFAYDVTNSEFDRLRISGECGGPVLETDSAITYKDCTYLGGQLHSCAGLSKQQQVKFQEYKRLSYETDALFDTWAKTIDRAERYPMRTQLGTGEWSTSGNRQMFRIPLSGDTMLIFYVYGNMEVFVNGQSAGRCTVPKLYRGLQAWACDLTALTRDGENEITVVWEDLEDIGGVDCKLPFFDFVPLRTGFQAPAVLCCR